MVARHPCDLGWLCASLLGSGCGGTGTDLNQLVNFDPFSDASPQAPDAGSGGGGSFQDPFGGAAPYASGMGSGSHNAGKSCIQDGCHGSGGGGNNAPAFLIGGTVYADFKGTVPAPGVEVRIVDSAGNSATTYSGPEGNFYISGAKANTIAFPAVVGARDATTSRPMITALTAGMASCGQSTCHVPGGGPTSNTGNYYPIHVP